MNIKLYGLTDFNECLVTWVLRQGPKSYAVQQ